MSTADAEKIIYTMSRVTKTVNRKEILKDISLSYFHGAKIGVLGLNGSGKSTLLKLLAGAVAPTSGEVCVGRNLKFACPSGVRNASTRRASMKGLVRFRAT